MSFPVLTAHQIYPFFFQLGGRLSPISIRDQMVRSQMLIDQALDAGLIGVGNRPLLVVGAGAAGATAAIHAASQNVHTLLVDSNPKGVPFYQQAGCQSRWLDPSQYDWPVNHWYSAQYPWMPSLSTPPLAWRANWAYLLQLAWWNQLKQAVTQYPLWFLDKTTAYAPAPSNNPHQGGWTIDLTTDGRRWQGSFGMVVWAVGFGQETSFIRSGSNTPPTFGGFPFWATDPFAQSNYGLPQGTTPKIVISGAGDGALQDFLRIMTVHKSVRDIFRAIGLPRRVAHRLQSAENRAQHAYQWNHKEISDHKVLQILHDEHLNLASRLVHNAGVRHRLQKVLRNSLPEVHLVHSCNHFSNVYGLNRFLVLLIDAYLNLPNLIIPGKQTQNVVGVGHYCTGKYLPCYGLDHNVELVNVPNCWQRASGGGTQVLDANIIIIRHGLNAAALPQPQLPDVALSRQLLPYHVHS